MGEFRVLGQRIHGWERRRPRRAGFIKLQESTLQKVYEGPPGGRRSQYQAFQINRPL